MQLLAAVWELDTIAVHLVYLSILGGEGRVVEVLSLNIDVQPPFFKTIESKCKMLRRRAPSATLFLLISNSVNALNSEKEHKINFLSIQICEKVPILTLLWPK